MEFPQIVIEDIIRLSNLSQDVKDFCETRVMRGLETYGRRLTTFNGRDACQDLCEELSDGAFYALQMHYEELTKGNFEVSAPTHEVANKLLELLDFMLQFRKNKENR